ncbi:MAG: Ferric uptake regulation protein [Anaerocolumna sp.]|jgi:Fur family ferric uptake transcriptional regulator|nr:Ferric uptake regulation protein [Anaerocolumna sp.]
MNELLDKEPILTKIHKREIILEQLRKKKFRITEQRRLLIDVILEDECSSCKEIYYKAVKKDTTVGIATVYRMVKTLEDLGVINRKNLYQIEYEKLDIEEDNKALYLDEKSDKITEIPKGLWFEELKKLLTNQGITDLEHIQIIVKNKNKEEEECCDDRLYNSCSCSNHSCKYHCKKRSAS